MKLINHIKVDILIFIISIFLQGFSIIKTSSFGIAFSVMVILYLALKYRMITKVKHNKNFIFINISILVLILISYLANDIGIDLLKIFRVEMLFISVYFTMHYLKLLYKNKYFEVFIDYLYKATTLISIYGIYQYIAYNYKLPLFMNIFRNNPSYNLNNINLYSYYGGWYSNRIYSTFAEPSFYAEFVVILMVIMYICYKKYINFKKFIFIESILLLNLIFTYSRSGIVEFIYIYVAYIVFVLIVKFRVTIFKVILWMVAGIIPIINIYALQIANKVLFNDLSSVSRTESVLYYLSRSFENVKATFLGHGLGIMQKDTSFLYISNNIEKYAHNGYVEIIYENGIVVLLILLIAVLSSLKGIANEKYKFLLFLVVVNTNDFGTGYNIESILILLVVMIVITSNESVKLI